MTLNHPLIFTCVKLSIIVTEIASLCQSADYSRNIRHEVLHSVYTGRSSPQPVGAFAATIATCKRPIRSMLRINGVIILTLLSKVLNTATVKVSNAKTDSIEPNVSYSPLC